VVIINRDYKTCKQPKLISIDNNELFNITDTLWHYNVIVINGDQSMTTINFVHANGFPAPTYNVFFEQLQEQFTPHSLNIIAKHQYAHDPMYPLVDHWSNQVTEVIEHIQAHANEPVIGIGHSFGAVVTYMAACKAPQLFKGVVLCDPPIMTGLGGRFIALLKRLGLIDYITPAKRTLQRRQWWDLHDDMRTYFAQKALFKDFHPQCIDDYVKSVSVIKSGKKTLTYDVNVEVDIFRYMPTNIHHFYNRCEVPSLLLTGRNTTVTMPMFVKPFLKGNPSMLHEYVDGGHLFVLEKPKKTVHSMHRFITDLI
jgi:pimeloyl-ACP methyl ester carboxylesterase